MLFLYGRRQVFVHETKNTDVFMNAAETACYAPACRAVCLVLTL